MKQSVKLLLLAVLFCAHCTKAQDEEADDPGNDADPVTNIPDEINLNGTNQLDNKRAGRISGGTTVSIVDYPFVVTVKVTFPMGGFTYATGVIISNSHVLSLPLYNPAGSVITVRVGSDVEDSGGSVIKAIDYIIHPLKDATTRTNMVAIVTIDGTFSAYANARPVAVQTSEILISAANPTNCVTVGWGYNAQGQKIVNLNRADYTLAAVETCPLNYGPINPTMQCAKSVSGMICDEENRFPLVCKNKLYGLALSSDCMPGTHVFVKIPAASIQQFLAPYLPPKKMFNCPCNSC